MAFGWKGATHRESILVVWHDQRCRLARAPACGLFVDELPALTSTGARAKEHLGPIVDEYRQVAERCWPTRRKCDRRSQLVVPQPGGTAGIRPRSDFSAEVITAAAAWTAWWAVTSANTDRAVTLQVCPTAGAEAVTLINTPRHGDRSGCSAPGSRRRRGYSGKPSTRLPYGRSSTLARPFRAAIIGVGGVFSGWDAVELIRRRQCGRGGTANFVDPRVAEGARRGRSGATGIGSVSELVGGAHWKE
jgi:hypothetical protein